MKKAINYYINQFQACFDGEPWYGKSLMAILQDAKTEAVYHRASQNGHSAYEITGHLLAWRELLVKKLKGDFTSSITANSEEDWPSLPAKKDAAQWKQVVDRLRKNQDELVAALGKLEDATLTTEFAATEYTLRTFLEGQLQHDIYHTGQIALALKNY